MYRRPTLFVSFTLKRYYYYIKPCFFIFQDFKYLKKKFEINLDTKKGIKTYNLLSKLKQMEDSITS